MSSLYVDRRGVALACDGEALVFRENGERVGTVPLAPIKRVFLRGDVQLSASLLGKLGERGVGVVVLSGRKAEPSLMLARPHNDAARRLAQFRLSGNAAFRLQFAQCLVLAKLNAQRAVLTEARDRDHEHRYEMTVRLRQLDELPPKILAAGALPGLRGLEGAAAQIYFAGLQVLAPPRLKFSGRNRRPPRDPVNAVLSLAYTLLHSEAVLALHGGGLDPYVGFFHELDFGRESLACDVIEPLRPQVDALVLRLFRKEVLRPEDFSTSEAGCLLGKAGRSRFYPAWEEACESLRKALEDSVSDLAAAIMTAGRPEAAACRPG
jgi:CRISP-associated protein Cas1